MTIRVALTVPSGRTGGIARYGWNLLGALQQEADLELVPIADRSVLRELGDLGAGGIEVPADAIAQAVAIQDGIGRALRRRHVEVVHGLKHVVPRNGAVRVALTAHDDFLFTRPQDYGRAKRLLLPRVYRAALRRADAVLAVSDVTAAATRRLVPGGRVHTVRHPFETDLGALAPEPLPLDDVGPATPLGLFVGDWLDRKNLPFLLDVWADVHRATGAVLLLAGPPGGSPATMAAVAEAADRGAVRPVGRVTDAQLAWCYRRAAVTCVPSREEGWGLPVTESLSLGTPVVASTHPAIVEAAGGAAVHLPTDERAAWVDVLVAVTAGFPPTGRRPRDAGRTWATVAAEVAAHYRRLARAEATPSRPDGP